LKEGHKCSKSVSLGSADSVEDCAKVVMDNTDKCKAGDKNFIYSEPVLVNTRYIKKYENKWPNCENSRNECISIPSTMKEMESKCDANSLCVGFSWTKSDEKSTGCLKMCSSESEAGYSS